MEVSADVKTIYVKGVVKPQISVQVVDQKGDPIPGATVEVGSIIWELTPFKYVTEKITDENGFANFSGWLPGGYLIQAYLVELGVQATPRQVNIDLLGKATPESLKMELHGAPWHYTLDVDFPAIIGVLPAQIMAELIKIEAEYPEATIDEVRVIGAKVEIDYHLVHASPFVVTGSIIFAIFVGLGVLIVLGVIGWLLHERFKPPKPKDKFPCPICEESFSDQETLAQHLITEHADANPYMCAYEGCNLRFPTAEDKIKHMETFHKEELPLVKIASIIAGLAAVAYVLGKMLAGGAG